MFHDPKSLPFTSGYYVGAVVSGKVPVEWTGSFDGTGTDEHSDLSDKDILLNLEPE